MMISLRVIRSTGEAIEFSRDMSLSGTLTLSNSLLENANSLAATWELIRRSVRPERNDAQDLSNVRFSQASMTATGRKRQILLPPKAVTKLLPLPAIGHVPPITTALPRMFHLSLAIDRPACDAVTIPNFIV